MTVEIPDDSTFAEALDIVRAEVVRHAVIRCGGCRAQAARELAISREGLMRVVRKLHVALPPPVAGVRKDAA